jgi:hypothetical protein
LGREIRSPSPRDYGGKQVKNKGGWSTFELTSDQAKATIG